MNSDTAFTHSYRVILRAFNVGTTAQVTWIGIKAVIDSLIVPHNYKRFYPSFLTG
jgi:hypothetical protein